MKATLRIVGGESWIDVKNIKLIDGKNGLFMSLPGSGKFEKDGKTIYYNNLVPDEDTFKMLNEKLIERYKDSKTDIVVKSAPAAEKTNVENTPASSVVAEEVKPAKTSTEDVPWELDL